ncbi:MAG: F0F1 ATP synthase subunit alpha [Erysipelotrichaceae bacterium]|jgi:F-type H+-transporting ATPase subunit alpha|nr:F0F1 ATP synthase subunit alpha [Erysipelotrichaceae bacterium]
MKINTYEISALIKAQIKEYRHKVASHNVGNVISVGDGIAHIYGLDKAMLGELLLFPNDVYGMVMNLNADSVGAVLLGNDSLVKEGDLVNRTEMVMEVPVGETLLGRVVNALGQPIDGVGEIKFERRRPIEVIAPGVMKRKSVDTPLETGITMIDALTPIGRGQRELIIGDRQTGKTALAIDTIINQRGKNVICIYVAIGQKNSTVAQIVDKLKRYKAMDYTIVVSASASEAAPLQYIAPYAGVAMAEEFMHQGKDVLIVYDDLSKHAVSYRALSLLLKRSPGREAYPGDVFYLHSRLLERACKLAPEYGGGSITALPIVETQSGDISAYIPTNVISITDGQIFLQTDLFNAGQRPAIDSGLSVSRVGGDAQFTAMKQVSRSLKIELASYLEMKSFAQFGSDLDASTLAVLRHGEALMSVLKQNQYQVYQLDKQVFDLYAAKNKYLDFVDKNQIRTKLDEAYAVFKAVHQDVLDNINKNKIISQEDEMILKQELKIFFESGR